MSINEVPATGYGQAFGTRRLLNDSIAKTAERLDDGKGASFGFYCECGDLNCKKVIRLTVAQYHGRSGTLLAHAARQVA